MRLGCLGKDLQMINDRNIVGVVLKSDWGYGGTFVGVVDGSLHEWSIIRVRRCGIPVGFTKRL